MKARWFACLAAALLAGAGIAALSFFLLRDDSLTRLKEEGVIRIGYAVEPPYAYLGSDQEVTGEAPEIARRIAGRLNIPKIEWRQYEFGSLIEHLEAGRIDVIAAGMFITPDRERRVLFSVPTLQVRPAMLVAGGNPLRIRSYRRAAKRKNVRFAVLAGSREERMLAELGVEDARRIVVPDARTGQKAVESGFVHALLLSEPTLRWMGRESGRNTLSIVTEPDHQDGDTVYGRPAFAFQSYARRLHQAWNAELRQFLGSDEHRQLLIRLGLDMTSDRSEQPDGTKR